MTLPAQNIHARPLPDQAAEVRTVRREDAIWNRPVFRPPPLQVRPVQPDMAYSGTIQRTEPWASWPRASAPSK
jgi:hypothetical protein